MMSHTFVTFRAGNQMFALALRVVQQVVRLPAITPVAGALPVIAGLLDFHGRLIPVLIGHYLLEQPVNIHLNTMVMILGVNVDQPQLGLLVDEVYGVYQAQATDLTPLTIGSNVLMASLHTNNGVMPVLDPAVLAAYAQIASVSEHVG
ncbi:chemotaxis protein CheW [uncultured Chloroflexus sp.]|uniref:chemotaxis protein CheW n=1 Tax=uncultured Chloroflexus sp. TaxID=214040 RepID=UPI00261FF2B2|nr:chemotaxis protein CheW [uncultured Chloroflexus sp.]